MLILVNLGAAAIADQTDLDPQLGEHVGMYFVTEKGPWLESADACDQYASLVAGFLSWRARLETGAYTASVDIALTGVESGMRRLISVEAGRIAVLDVAQLPIPSDYAQALRNRCYEVEGRSWLFRTPVSNP